MNRLRALVCGSLLGLVLMTTPAFGHAAYKDSEPADGATVSSPPSRVTAEFTEPLAEGSFLQVFDPCGRQVDAGDVSIVGYEMSVSMSGSAAGAYVVHFRAHSRLDPHVTQGDFGFTATDGEACPGAETEVDSGSQRRSGGGGDGADPDPGTSTSETVSGSGGSDARPSGSGNRDASPQRGGGGGPRSSRVGRERATVPNLAAGRELPAEDEGNVWDGIRLGPFLTGLLLAALIGAAGGKIYAGIMGPRA